MADTPSVIVVAKAKRKTSSDKQVPRIAAHGAEFNPAEVVALPEESAAFDPHLFLTKLAAGKTIRQYKSDESVFSQGDAADAVFYIQSGKVKLTAVSAQGKEAVVAILPEGSFFGEGCLAGQPLRMATATAVQRAAIIRVDEAGNGHAAPPGTGICRTISRLPAYPEHSHGSGLGGSPLQLQ